MKLAVSGYHAESYTGLFAPAATPTKAIIARLHGEVAKALSNPGLVRERFASLGADAESMSPRALRQVSERRAAALGQSNPGRRRKGRMMLQRAASESPLSDD
jgi:hypothetical protein